MTVSSQPGLLRPLGHLERMFWLKNQHMPYHFAIAAEIAGPTTIAAWRAAFEAVRRRHPNFSVKIASDETGAPCFYHVPGVPIPLRIVTTDQRWESEMERELATPFDATKAPLVRAVLLVRPSRTFLILAAHHSIADTKSLVFAIRDALQAMAGPAPEPLPPIGSLDSWLERFRTAPRCDASGQGSFPAPATLDVYRKPDGTLPSIGSLSLTSSLTGAIRRRSREEDTTVHGALVAAAAAAARELSPVLKRVPISIGSAVDYRNAVGAGEDVALLSAGGSIAAEHQMRNFWDLARFAKRSIEPVRSPEAMSVMSAGLGRYFSVDRDERDVGALMAGFRFDINISNLGSLAIETRFGERCIERLWGPSILAGFEGEQEIGASTLNGSLSLLHTSYKPLPAFLPHIEKQLAAACM
ncbi:MAG TPA: hypothetical protein VGC09_00820 [Rhodopila sp.]